MADGHYHPVERGGAIDWRTAYSTERPARQVSALQLTPAGAAWNGGERGKTHYCEEAYPCKG